MPKTPAERRAQRVADLDWMAQQQATFEAEKAARQAEHAAFVQRVEAYHENRAAALERGFALPPVVVPSLDDVFQAKAAQERAEAERLEQERLAALDPRAVLISALPPAKRDFIGRWQDVNPGVQFPLEALTMH